VKEALESLYSHQLILVSNGNLTKPYASEVSLYKSDRLLQLTIASKVKRRFFNTLHYQFRRFLPSIVFSVPLLTLVGVYRLKLLGTLIPVLLAFIVNLLAPSLSWELIKALSFGELELWMSPEKVTLSRQVGWLKIPVLPPAATDAIFRIERRNVALTIEDGRATVIPPCLVLIAGEREYTIHANQDIGEAELDWLAHQFGDWLELPIARV
jgi:ABC-type dipeptide/oligopeptide/nickel transport system permease component